MRILKLKTIQQRALKRTKNKRGVLYAKIDWKKAESLFQRPAAKHDDGSRYPPVREVLRVMAGVGAVGMIFLFPGAAPGFAALLGLKRYRDYEVNQVMKRLIRQKYVSLTENDDGTTTIRITKSGLTRALTYELDTMHLVKPTKWDKKWRVVVFDVPEKYKGLRNAFRMRLQQLGLHQLQESVYVSPYPCFDEVEFLRELYGVAFTTKYLLVEKIEDDVSLREHFSLSQ